MYPDKNHFEFFFIGLRLVCCLSLVFISAPASADLPDGTCESATRIELNTTTRDIGSRCYQADIPFTGTMWLDVSVPGPAQAEARLAFFGQACGGHQLEDGAFAYLEQFAAGMMLEIRAPGEYIFCVAPQDPANRLAEIRLRSTFVEGFHCTKGSDPEVDEPPPDPFSSSSCVPTKGSDPEVDEPPPDPFGTGWGMLQVVRESMCHLGEIDDHGDTAACATAILPGRSLTGEIGTGWGDDLDFFGFYLPELATVRLETTGETDTFGGLYDRRGHRLAMDDDGGSDGNFRLVKTLTPGIYFVRVEGRDQAEGRYQINVGVWR